MENTLRASVATWLRYDKQCPVISFERGFGYYDRPDVIAVTGDRRLIEVEIKISVGDFKKDAKKEKWGRRRQCYRQPHWFYYAVPPEIVDLVKPLVPEGRGLVTLNNPSYSHVMAVLFVLRAKCDRQVPRVSLKEIVRMVRNQSGTLCGLAAQLAAKGEPVCQKPKSLRE